MPIVPVEGPAVTAPPLPPAPGRWATVAVLLVASAMIASWLPQYLAWPWWPDVDAWATIAQGWDAGMRPYRDVVIFNFPGQIYEAWLLGKVFGWGRTAPFYALDAALLMGLGGLLAAWARARFGRALPGLIGWVAVLAVYMNRDYTFAAQRDWQGPLLAAAGLLALQTWPGRWGRIASAALMAAGFAIRPHVVLFLPAIVAALFLDREGVTWRRRLIGAIAWGAAFAGWVAVAFAPLAVQGLLDDFVRGVRQASYASGYGRGTRPPVTHALLTQLGLFEFSKAFNSWDNFAPRVAGWRFLATALATITLAPTRRGRVALPWAVALVLVLLYGPLHPKAHSYLVLPSRLFWAVALGALTGVILARLSGRPKAATLAFAAALVLAVPVVPAFCLPVESYEVLMGRASPRVPAPARPFFAPVEARSPYRWEDYRSTLAYLRTRTGPQTRVGNMLSTIPFPTVNGVTGRLSPWPAESGIIWIWSVNPKLEGAFVEALARSPGDTVVVWSPGEKPVDDNLKLDDLRAAVRRTFHFEAAFGPIQVWRKNPVAIPGAGR